MIREYIKAVTCVFIGYIMTFAGYIPSLDIHETSIVPILQQILEIGPYKPITLISASFAVSAMPIRSGTKGKFIGEARNAMKAGIEGGICSFAGFLFFILLLLFFFPVISEEEKEIMAGYDLHFQVYETGSPLMITLFHGMLLFSTGVFISSIYWLAFQKSGNRAFSFLLTLVAYQSITFVQSLMAIPDYWKVDNLSSGCFRNPLIDSNFAADIMWWLLMAFIINIIASAVYVLALSIRSRKTGA